MKQNSELRLLESVPIWMVLRHDRQNILLLFLFFYIKWRTEARTCDNAGVCNSDNR